MVELKDEFVAFISKFWALLFYLFIGVVGKISYNILYGKKMSWVQILASIGIGLFMGFLAWVFCLNHGHEKQIGWVVPIATLLSEKLIVAAVSLDYKSLLKDVMDMIRNRMK